MVADNGWRSAGESDTTRRILVIDDHPVIRYGLERLIEQEDDLRVCADANTALSAFAAIADQKPHVVLTDISLEHCDGIELIRDIRAHCPLLPVLVLSNRDESLYAERMLSVGANGYISKQMPGEQIVLALRHVLDGGTYVSAAVGSNIINGFSTRGSYTAGNPIDRLSNRELQILNMVGRGMTTRETARTLSLSIKTVDSHRQRLKRKLNLGTGTQLMQYAINWFADRQLRGGLTDGFGKAAHSG